MTNNIDTTLPVETLGNSTTKILETYIDEIVSNLTLSNILNETAIDENDIEEYLSNRKYRNIMTRKLLMIIVYDYLINNMLLLCKITQLIYEQK